MTDEFPAASESVSSESRTWAIAAHLGPLLIGFIAPLVVWLVKREEDPFIEDHSRESLNFQLTVLIGFVISWVLAFILWGLGLLAFFAVAIFALIFMIQGAIAASNNKLYKYPVSAKLVSG